MWCGCFFRAGAASPCGTPMAGVRRGWSSGGPVRRDERMRAALAAGLAPVHLLVEASDAGCDGGSVTIEVASPMFVDLPRVKQHKMVAALVKDDLAHFHAVHISTAAPNE